MKTNKKQYSVLLGVVLLLIVSCAPKVEQPFYLNIERLNNIHKIVIRINQASPQLYVFDTNIRKNTVSKTYGGTMHGALGGALEALLLEAVAQHRINKALGGDIRELEAKIDSRRYDEMLKNMIAETLSRRNGILKKYDIVYITESVNIKPTDLSDSLPMLKAIATKYGADLLVDIDYVYGLGVHESANPKAMIQAILNVTDLRDNSLMIYRDLTSGFFYTGSRFDEYVSDDGALFKEEYIEAAERIGDSIADVLYMD